MKLYMRITANAEIDVDEENGKFSDMKVTSTELYSSEDLINWTMLEGGELDCTMTELVKNMYGLGN